MLICVVLDRGGCNIETLFISDVNVQRFAYF